MEMKQTQKKARPAKKKQHKGSLNSQNQFENCFTDKATQKYYSMLPSESEKSSKPRKPKNHQQLYDNPEASKHQSSKLMESSHGTFYQMKQASQNLSESDICERF